MSAFTAACVQMVSQADLEANLDAAKRLIAEAHAKGAALVCLPENAFYMRDSSEGGAAAAFEEAEHPGVKMCVEEAAKKGAHILIGSIAVPAEGGRAYNRSVLIGPQGVIGTYNKIHLFDVTLPNGETYRESERIAPGDAGVVATLPWGKIGMSVCYDLRFPQLYRALAKAGADFLAIPAAFTHTTGKAHWHILLRARAIETGAFVFAPAQGGVHNGRRRTYGHAMIVSPWGEILAEAPEEGEAVICAKVDVTKVAEARAQIPALIHELETYAVTK
ncbi:MAG: carbon-nitrogen hydrolase family protein [Alphaproteobacteria bacterium]|nr:carbon-nitrogen hydrolase family protein [Alphaproteobacteria bacterium]